MIKTFLKRLIISLIFGLFLVYLLKFSYFKMLLTILFSCLGFIYNYLNENDYIYLNGDNYDVNYDYNLYIESSNNDSNSSNNNSSTSNNNSSTNVSNSTSNNSNTSNEEIPPSVTIPINRESAGVVSTLLSSAGTGVGVAAGITAGLEVTKGMTPITRSIASAGIGFIGGVTVGLSNLAKNNETKESSFFNLEEWINWLTTLVSGTNEEVIIKGIVILNLGTIFLLLLGIYLLLFRFFVGERFLDWVFSKLSFIKSSRLEQIKNWIFFYKKVQIKMVDYNVFIIILCVIILSSVNIYTLYSILNYSSVFK